MEFNVYKKSNIHYGGSEEKIGIIIENREYLVKFQKETETGRVNNHICEYIGSSIIGIIGEDVQNTTLGTYNGRNVVVCMDFKSKGDEFVPFNDVGDSSLERDRELYQYTYEDIIEILEENQKLTNVKETIGKFWDLYIIDALLGNFDRHGSNWGFIRKNGAYKMAPIFDNGSCLFPRICKDEQCSTIMNSIVELDKRTYKFPTSQIKLGTKKSSYFDVISSLEYEECNHALTRIYKKIDLNKINRFLDTVQDITVKQKEFYKLIIKYRYNKIIKYSYFKLEGEKKWIKKIHQ